MARRLCIVLAASLFLMSAACGTTGGDQADGKTTPSSKESDGSKTEKGDDTSTTDAGGEGDNPEFCAAAAKLNTLFDDLADDDYQGMVDAVGGAEGAFDTYVEKIPEEMKDEAQLLVESLKTLAAEVDAVKDDPDAADKVRAAAEKLGSEEVTAAGETVNGYEKEACPDG